MFLICPKKILMATNFFLCFCFIDLPSSACIRPSHSLPNHPTWHRAELYRWCKHSPSPNDYHRYHQPWHVPSGRSPYRGRGTAAPLSDRRGSLCRRGAAPVLTACARWEFWTSPAPVHIIHHPGYPGGSGWHHPVPVWGVSLPHFAPTLPGKQGGEKYVEGCMLLTYLYLYHQLGFNLRFRATALWEELKGNVLGKGGGGHSGYLCLVPMHVRKNKKNIKIRVRFWPLLSTSLRIWSIISV